MTSDDCRPSPELGDDDNLVSFALGINVGVAVGIEVGVAVGMEIGGGGGGGACCSGGQMLGAGDSWLGEMLGSAMGGKVGAEVFAVSLF